MTMKTKNMKMKKATTLRALGAVAALAAESAILYVYVRMLIDWPGAMAGHAAVVVLLALAARRASMGALL